MMDDEGVTAAFAAFKMHRWATQELIRKPACRAQQLDFLLVANKKRVKWKCGPLQP
jgi:hypothetical protein